MRSWGLESQPAHIRMLHALGDEWRGNLAVVEQLEVNGGEERVLGDVAAIALEQ